MPARIRINVWESSTLSNFRPCNQLNIKYCSYLHNASSAGKCIKFNLLYILGSSNRGNRFRTINHIFLSEILHIPKNKKYSAS